MNYIEVLLLKSVLFLLKREAYRNLWDGEIGKKHKKEAEKYINKFEKIEELSDYDL